MGRFCRLFEWLRERGDWDNTLVVFTTDQCVSAFLSACILLECVPVCLCACVPVCLGKRWQSFRQFAGVSVPSAPSAAFP